MVETKDTMFGLLRRTGPASAELIDPGAGKVYGLSFAVASAYYIGTMQNGREIADDIFRPKRPDADPAQGDE